jgi:hypothetical protein
MSVLFGFWLARPAIAEAPQSNSIEINPPYGPPKPTLLEASSRPQSSARRDSGSVQSGRHSTRAENLIDVQSLQNYLSDRHSPLAGYSAQILQSPHWSTIIGICWIEQYGCTKALYNNYWGIMGGGGLRRFASLESGIQGISDLLAKYEANGRDTIEEFRGYYCVNRNYPGNVCPNWESTVLKIKAEVESL